jgi:hypothetical protein
MTFWKKKPARLVRLRGNASWGIMDPAPVIENRKWFNFWILFA